jgi:hypothetical protein
MGKSDEIAKEINNDIKSGKSIAQIKAERGIDDSSWQRYSAKAYALNIKEEKKKRLADEQKQHVATTSSVDMGNIIALNMKLADFAIILPVTSTISEFNHAVQLANQLPNTEPELLEFVERLTMQPQFRARQKKGRFEIFPFFKPVHKLIDAATLCFYRKNYISCYMTLVPVIEGIMLRWLNYDGIFDKPDFEKLRRFFNNGYMRQPMPWNIQFHEIFSQACGSLIGQHFFKPSDKGDAHDLFNRHLAAHLLQDGTFATHANCLRLFMLLDAMSEIYFYESRGQDPRFSLSHDDTDFDTLLFASLMSIGIPSPEIRMLG